MMHLIPCINLLSNGKMLQSLSDEEWERVKERARTKLEQSGWVDDVRQQCRGESDFECAVL